MKSITYSIIGTGILFGITYLLYKIITLIPPYVFMGVSVIITTIVLHQIIEKGME